MVSLCLGEEAPRMLIYFVYLIALVGLFNLFCKIHWISRRKTKGRINIYMS